MYYKTNEAGCWWWRISYFAALAVMSWLEGGAPQTSGVEALFYGNTFARLLGGLWARFALLISVAISMVLGVLLAGDDQENRWCAFVPVLFKAVRIVPVLVWLFLFGAKLLNIHLDPELASVLVFTLWGTAEMGDLVRGAVTSLPAHQRESGRALGLTEAQVSRYVVVPQAVRRLVPSAINLATRMIKTTSLVMLINVVEVLKVGQQIIEATSLFTGPTVSLWVYGCIFLLYFISLLSHFACQQEAGKQMGGRINPGKGGNLADANRTEQRAVGAGAYSQRNMRA
ncbi:MAG: ABC transporter permease subunit [Christensenellales bacterium]